MIKPSLTHVNRFRGRELRDRVVGLSTRSTGGFTCMPENAQVEIEDGLRLGRAWDDARREAQMTEAQLTAKALSLQLSGMVEPYTDAQWILNVLETTPLESLR